MGFESDRAKINHNTLKNDILARLTDDVSLISSPAAPERIKRLSQLLLTTKEVSDNMEDAIKYWRCPRWQEHKCNFSSLVRSFLSSAKELSHYAPTGSYPNDEQIDSWLAGMASVLDNLNWIVETTIDERELCVTKFWHDATALHDFLHDISRRAITFWDYFRERNT